MTRFDADTALTPAGEGRWHADITDAWNGIEGKPNGGYLFATALAALSRSLDGRQPLTATGHFLRPGSVGKAEIDVDVVRTGRLISTGTASLRQDGTERLRLLAGYTTGKPSDEQGFSADPPEIPGPDDCLTPPTPPNVGASIADRFDYRVTPTSRWIRGTKSAAAQLDAWIRFADGRAVDLAALPLVVDAFPPVIYEVADGVVVPTVELTVHFRQPPAAGWLQARVRSRALIAGMIEEDVDLWDAEGQLVAMSRQLAVVQPIG